jgi:ankyrin repeat protein
MLSALAVLLLVGVAVTCVQKKEIKTAVLRRFFTTRLGRYFLDRKYAEGDRIGRAILTNDQTTFHSWLEAKPDLEIRDKSLQTPLYVAVAFRRPEMLKALIDAHANVNSVNGLDVESPVALAVRNNDRELTQLLVAAGANINQWDRHGQTPLIFAAQEGTADLVDFLLKLHASPDLSDYKIGYTPLMWATSNDRVEIMESLLRGGAKVDVKNSLGQTALHVSAQYDCVQCADLLLRRGAVIDLQDAKGVTPFLVAIAENKLGVAAFLLKHGASARAKDAEGHDALFFARKSRSTTAQEFVQGIRK